MPTDVGQGVGKYSGNMARNTRWKGLFKSMRGNNYEILIKQDGYDGEPEMLTLGEEPFVTEEDSGEDFFMPVRRQSGYLSVVCSPSEAAQLLPDNNMQNYVELRRNGHIVWIGYMRNESYNQNPFGSLNTYQFPLICPLSVLENVEIEGDLKNSGGIYSIGQLLVKILQNCGVGFADIIVSEDVSNITQMDALVSFWNWLETNNDYDFSKEISEDNAIYRCKVNYYELLTDLCKFFGWTCRVYENGIFFDVISDECRGRVKVSFGALGSAEKTWETISNKPLLDLEDPYYLSDNNKESYVQGVSRVTISCNVNAYGDTLMKLPADEIRLRFGDRINITEYRKNTSSKPHAYKYEMQLVTRYAPSQNYNSNEDFKFKSISWKNRRLGANMFTDLSLIQISSTELDRISPNLVLKLTTKSSDIYNGVELSMESLEDFILPNGYISINGNAEGYNEKLLSFEKAFTISAITSWGGRQISDKISFDDKGRLASNKSIAQQMGNPSVPSGQWVDVNTPNHGKMKIYLNPVVTDDTAVPLYVFINNLNVSYGNKVALNGTNYKNEYKANTGNSNRAIKEVSLAICTYKNNVAGRALIVNSDYQYIERFSYNGRSMRPEERLLSRMVRQLSTRSRQLFIDVQDDDQMLNYPIFQTIDIRLATLSVSRKYKDDLVTLQLQELH